ncbi:type II toxin-antitoxin system PemK/MazF family toxin [Phenylobacterium sp.]|jgi:mRNA interferase MazF|uniref:type II toxin-antitoxin system PemK/MazF family toxin n=1 Tax=Phenylobacterium sp. TaxID=1871053 RepID=UPI0037C58A4B
MSLARGEVWVVAEKGHLTGKPRPAVLIQAEALDEHASLQFCLIYGAEDAQRDVFFRIPVAPTEANGLEQNSTIAVDKIVTIRRENVKIRCGTLEEDVMGLVNDALIAFQGLA